MLNDVTPTKRFTVTVTTSALGAATEYLPATYCNGRVYSVAYVKDATTPYDNGVDFTITTDVSGLTVWTEANVAASKTVLPCVNCNDNAGASLAGVYAPVMLCDDRIKIILASGGATTTGTFTVIIE